MLDQRLDEAVARGIITAEQAATIRALGSNARAGFGETREFAASVPREAPRTFNAATLAYVLGAITVIVAMGWFLSDRWDWLGAGGVLAVSVLYAGLFLLVALRMRRQGYEMAAGFGVLLAVLMAPVAAVALLELTHWLPSRVGVGCYYPSFLFWECRGEELIAELAVALAALVALRSTRFSPLLIPVTGIALRLLFHFASYVSGYSYQSATVGWVWTIGSSLLVAIAYETDRRQRGDEDFARWLYGGAAIAALTASIYLLDPYEPYRHLLIPGAFIAFSMALTLRRLHWLFLGMVWFVWYLGWLASDVFRNSPFFPVILAALGIGVIASTVWVQRNAKRLVARFGTVTRDGRPRYPGGVPLLLAPALVALLMLSDGRRIDDERRAVQEWESRRWRMRMHRQAKARRDSIEAGTLRLPGAPQGGGNPP